ncbi:MAG TPA: single-stranded DNA-binding protein [Candidatus Moranbacteria bacterium]|nr:single-stranded DNA-binding protein [Candidatus Moranbacteria bacterium]
MNVNKAIIIGRLTRDPELRSTQSGKQVASISVATSFTYKDKSGQKQEKTEFHNVISWGRQAEVIAQYFTKGQEIYVEGRLETRSWEDKETGKKMYRTEIVMDKFEFGAKPQGTSGGYNSNNQSNTATPTNTQNVASNDDNNSAEKATPQNQSNSQAQPQQNEEIPTINLDDEDQEEVKIEDVPF